jgi:hypothetical protein
VTPALAAGVVAVALLAILLRPAWWAWVIAVAALLLGAPAVVVLPSCAGTALLAKGVARIRHRKA